MPNSAESSQVDLTFESTGQTISHWSSYHFDQDFLTPASAFSFTIESETVLEKVFPGIAPGQTVSLKIDGNVQCRGYIDQIHAGYTRNGGSSVTVQGRDFLAPVIDASLDTIKYRFSKNQSLGDIIKTVFGQFGFTNITSDNLTNRKVISGAFQGVRTSKKGAPLKKTVQHQVKPYPNEGAYEFCERLAKRFGAHIWVTADGSSVVVSSSDFDQPALFQISSKRDNPSKNNVLSSAVTYDWKSQPSVIFANGFGWGAEFDRSSLKAFIINDPIARNVDGSLLPNVQEIIDFHSKKGAIQVQTGAAAGSDSRRRPSSVARPVFLHDEESHDLEELSFFLRRQLAVRQRKIMVAAYEMEGHFNNGNIWAVDTIVNVDDDFLGIHEPMYVFSRTLTKDRNSGTRTQLKLIRLNHFNLFE